jgi:hypothetical protein
MTPAGFWDRVDFTSDCWLWMGAQNGKGYGRADVILDGALLPDRRCHRISYQWLVGPIPTGFELDHLCHTYDIGCPGGLTCQHRRCVNPAHLEPVTSVENTLRGRSASALNAAKTHCKRGHELTPENTQLIVSDARRSRNCRTCIRTKRRIYDAVRRSSVSSLRPVA